MIFQYRVKDKAGNTSNGTLEAHTLDDAVKTLRDRDLLVITVHEQGEVAHQTKVLSGFLARVGFGEVVDFTRQLSTMIIAGLPLVDSLALLEGQTKNASFKGVMSDIIQGIRGGKPFSEALKTHPKQFSKIYVALVSAGEKSGKLDVVLERLADNLEKTRSFRSKLKTAMIYPLIIVIGIVLLTMLMMIFVIPQLTEIYSSFNVELPLPTRILIGASKFMVNFWWLVISAMVGIFLWFPSFTKTEGGSRIMDAISLRAPVFGSLKKDMIMAEMTRTLGLLVGAGVPILEGLEIVADALDSRSYTESTNEIAKKVEKGFPLGLMFSQNPVYPPIVGQMLIVGEETGKIDETMDRISKYFEQQADEKVKRLSTAIEPIILVLLGVGVAFVVLSIVLPMYQLTEAF
jgi:type IV pilus assembly protein PilC